MIPCKPSPFRLPLRPLLLLPLMFVSPAHALQIVDAQDGQTALGKISAKEVTRIAFERGRVRKVTGSAGEFVLEKDDEKGQIFVRPIDPQSTKPINLFLTSERGTIALLLQPVDTPSDSIVIREPRDSSAAPTRSEASGRHVRTIKNLLLALADDALPEDMEAREPARDVALWPGTQLTLQRVLLGTGVVGEKYQLINIRNTTCAIRPLPIFERSRNTNSSISATPLWKWQKPRSSSLA